MQPVLESRKLSKWYGNILGINDVSLKISPGIVGLLGPNGAGKSTFLKIASGQLKQNSGEIRIFGSHVFSRAEVFARVGVCPESDGYFSRVTGKEFLEFIARLHQISSPGKTARRLLEDFGLWKSADKYIQAYSLGMRQRLKLAASIVNDPELLIFDEPLRGVDPLWRVKIINMIRKFRKEGKTVIVSSHILPEIESMTNQIILIHQGKIFAQGDIHEIRGLLDSHPHMITVVSSRSRDMAEHMIRKEFILSATFQNQENSVTFKTNDRDRFFSELTALIAGEDLEIEEITSPDDNLQAVFNYLLGSKS